MDLLPNFNVRTLAISFAVLLFTGCSQTSAISDKTRNLNLPTNWQQEVSAPNSELSALGDWSLIIADYRLQSVIAKALTQSPELIAAYNDLQIAKEQLTVTGASDYPALTLSLDNSRRKSVSSDGSTITNSAGIDLNLSYEVDIWGKLSAEQQQSSLQFQASKVAFEQAKNNIVTDVVGAWFALVEAQKLLGLYQVRAENLESNYDIINSSYKLGLSEALDVYLNQNNVNSELARIEQQKQTVLEKQRALDVLLGQYPTGDNFSDIEIALQQLEQSLFTALPADVLTNSFAIQQSWFSLLAADAGLAVAHKNRFPSLNLTASTGDSSDELSNLLDGGALAWSVAGSLTAPLFNAGRLKSLEEQARLTVKKQEQQYLTAVFTEFADMENRISSHSTLTKQLAYYKKAEENAVAAETLAFNQYVKGLNSYTTVLEAQRRAFDAQVSVIQVSNQLIQNRIAMYAKLGGSDLAQTIEQKVSTIN